MSFYSRNVNVQSYTHIIWFGARCTNDRLEGRCTHYFEIIIIISLYLLFKLFSLLFITKKRSSMILKDFGCNRQKVTYEQRSSSQIIVEEGKEKVSKGTMYAYLNSLQIVQTEETQVTDDIFRPRSDDGDCFSDRTLFLSRPLPLVNSTDDNKNIPNLNHAVSDKSNDENCVSRFDAFNSISKDLSKSCFTCPLLEEYRVPTSGEELCIHGSSKLDAFKECRSF